MIAWGIAPYRAVLPHLPWKVDALKWVGEAASTQADWPTWVFLSRHFVGYRPVAALSFTLNDALGGYWPAGMHGTDLALHGLAAAAVALVYRGLVGRSTPGMLLAAVIFLGHPAAEEAVPYLARRSYLLATLFGTLGIAAFLEHLRRVELGPGGAGAGRFAALSAALIGLGLLSNEVAYVLVPLLPVLAWAVRGQGWRDALGRAALPMSPALLTIALRFWVLGWAGGYYKRYFAFVRGDEKVLREVFAFNGGDILAAALTYLWFPVGMEGARPLLARSALVIGATAAAMFWMLVVEPLVDWRDRQRRIAGLLGLWMLGYALLYIVSQTWFWRQGYPMVVPLALALTWVARDAWVRYAAARWIGALRLLPVGLVVAGVLWHGAPVAGLHPGPLAVRAAGTELVRAVEAALAEVEGPGRVYVALPMRRGPVYSARASLERLLAPRGIEVRTLASGTHDPLVWIEGEELVFGPRVSVPEELRRVARVQDGRAPLARLRAPGRPTWLLFPEGEGWALVPLDPR